MVLDAYLFNTQHYKVQIQGKWSNPGKRVAAFRTQGVVVIKKGVTVDYGRLIASLQRGEACLLISIQGIKLNPIWWWDFSPGALKNMEYPYIAITHWSTMTQIGRTC